MGSACNQAHAHGGAFHRWAAGNLLENTVRGLFAEYIVHQALGVDPGQHRIEWTEHDIVGPGWTAEVKAAAYIQSWDQARPSRISFKIEKRTSTFYVFALLAEQDRSRVNPEDLSQWRFWLVPTAELPDQKSIGLAALQRLASGLSTLEYERREAKRLAEGGTFLDLTEVDVSEAWTVAQELGIDRLIRAETIHSGSPEVKAVWSALTALDKTGAKRVARALGGRAHRIPAPMDQLEPRTIWPLVKAVGFTPVKVGETRAEGKWWRLEPTKIT